MRHSEAQRELGGKERGSGWKGERKGGEGREERKEEERRIKESSMTIVFLNCRKAVVFLN